MSLLTQPVESWRKSPPSQAALSSRRAIGWTCERTMSARQQQEQDPAQLHMLKVLAEGYVGPFLLGAFITIFLYGLFVMQMMALWTRGKSDPRYIQLLVFWMFCLASITTACSIAISYYLGVSSFGNLAGITVTHPAGVTIIVILGLSGSTAQSFYAYRILRLTKRYYIPVLLWMIGLTQVGFAIFIADRAAALRDFAKFLPFESEIDAWLYLSLAGDIIMSFTQVIYLQMQKTGFKATDTLLMKLSRVIIQTGLATSIVAAITLALYKYSLSHSKITYLLSFCPLSILYVNCIMSNLNARAFGDRDQVQISELAIQLSSSKGAQVHIVTESFVQHDIELGNSRSHPSPNESDSDRLRDGSSLPRDGDSPASDKSIPI